MRGPETPSLRVRCGRALQRLGRRLAAGHDADGGRLPAWVGAMEQAAARGELALVYQPKLSLREDRIDSVEALLRWTPAAGDAPSPTEFIPVAERCGAIRPISEWVLETAIADQRRMAAAGLDVGIGINLSGRLVADAGFTAWALARCGSAAGAITLEITETAVIEDPLRALENLHAYAEAGVRIAIDDYGEGLSSLAYLKQLPARELKIDRLFIHGLVSSHRDPLLVRSTIDLAHALDMEVTAEGVETAMALSLLRVMGCDHVQGFQIAPPLSLDALIAFVTGFAGEAATTQGARAAGPMLARISRKSVKRP